MRYVILVAVLLSSTALANYNPTVTLCMEDDTTCTVGQESTEGTVTEREYARVYVLSWGPSSDPRTADTCAALGMYAPYDPYLPSSEIQFGNFGRAFSYNASCQYPSFVPGHPAPTTLNHILWSVTDLESCGSITSSTPTWLGAVGLYVDLHRAPVSNPAPCDPTTAYVYPASILPDPYGGGMFSFTEGCGGIEPDPDWEPPGQPVPASQIPDLEGEAEWQNDRQDLHDTTLVLTVIGDADSDGVPDGEDNCVYAWNPDQRDPDEDGFGAICDADFDNNGGVGISDSNIFSPLWMKTCADPEYDPDVDMDGNCGIGVSDWNLFSTYYGTTMSDLACVD